MLCFAIFLVGCLFVSLRFLRGTLPVFALSCLRGGVRLFCSLLAPSQSVLPALSGALGGLPGSLLCLLPGYGSSCFHVSLWCFSYLPCGPYALAFLRPLVGSTVSSLGSRRYVLSSTLFLCSHASWPVLGSSSRFSWSWGFLHTGVVSSASWSCLWGPLGGILLLYPRGLPLGSVSWGVFQALRMFRGFSLLFCWLSCPSVSSLCQSGAVSEPLILLAAVVPGSLIPLRRLTFCRLVSVPVCPRDSCGLAGFVLRTLRWCSAVSLLFVGLLLVMVRPVLFLFSVSFCPFLGALLSELYSFSPSGLLSARPFILSPCPLGFSFLLVVCSCLLSPVGRLVSPGSTRLWRPPGVRGALPRVVLVLCLRFVSVRLPSFLPLLLLRCLAAWWLFFLLGRLLHYVHLGLLVQRWFPWGCVLCFGSKFSHLIRTKASSVGLVCIPSGWGRPLGSSVFCVHS